MPVKRKVKILLKFLALSEYMNFNQKLFFFEYVHGYIFRLGQDSISNIFWGILFFRFFVTISRSGIHPNISTTNRQLIVFVEYLHTGLSSLGVPGAMAHPNFGRSVNINSTRGDRLCPPNYYWHTRIFRPSDGPDI